MTVTNLQWHLAEHLSISVAKDPRTELDVRGGKGVFHPHLLCSQTALVTPTPPLPIASQCICTMHFPLLPAPVALGPVLHRSNAY